MEWLLGQIYSNFIEDHRWRYLTNGLKVTLEVTFFAVIIGIVLGLLIAVVRSTYVKTGKLKIANFLCGIYITVIRGTPVVVQLLIIYFVVFGSVKIDKVLVAIMAFGLNSGAYVAEIFRSLSCPLTTDSLRQEEAWASATGRRCFTSSCPRPSRTCFRLSETSSSFS